MSFRNIRDEGIQKVASAAERLLLLPPDGTVVEQLDTHTLYIYDQTTNTWSPVGGGGGGGNAFGIIQTDTGTSPTADTATDTLNLVSADPTKYSFNGNATTDTVTLSITGFVPSEYNVLQKEPTGFPNRTDSTISFTNATRIFSISPVAASFDFYIKGTKYTKTTAQNVTIPALSGNHYIYFDATGTLVSTQTFTSAIITDFAFVSIVYWNTDTNSQTYFAEERHGLVMDGETHAYLHSVLGARYLSGLALTGFNADGSGASNSSAQFTSEAGAFRDEDIRHEPPAQSQIPILFRQGAQWRKKAADAYPLIYSGTAGYVGANGRIPFNELISGSWQLTQASNTFFVLVHFFATNDVNNPIVGVQGIAEYASVSGARQGANSEIASLSGLPFAEFVPIGSVIFETSQSYTNVPAARVRSTDTGGDYVDFRGSQLLSSSSATPTNHSLLSNLSSDDHLQYLTDARGDIRYYLKSQTYTQQEVKLVSIVNALIFG